MTLLVLQSSKRIEPSTGMGYWKGGGVFFVFFFPNTKKHLMGEISQEGINPVWNSEGHSGKAIFSNGVLERMVLLLGVPFYPKKSI